MMTDSSVKQTGKVRAVGPSHGCCWTIASSDLNTNPGKMDENDARKNIPEVKQNYTNLERWLLVGLCSVCNQAVVVRDGD